MNKCATSVLLIYGLAALIVVAAGARVLFLSRTSVPIPAQTPAERSAGDDRIVVRRVDTPLRGIRLFADNAQQSVAALQNDDQRRQGSNVPVLLGIASDRGERVALVLYQSVVRRVREREKLGRWTVEAIDVRAARLSGGPGDKLLRLDPQSSER